MTNLSSIAGFSSGGGAGGGLTALCADTATSSVQVPIHATSGTNRTHSNNSTGWIGGQCTNGVLKARNTFGHWVYYSDNTAGALRQGVAMTPITVNRSTGAITVGTPQDVWVNTNVGTGNVTYSVTLDYDPVHGCFMNSGLAGWDLSSSTEYSYGHAYGQLQTDGTVNLQACATTNAHATMYHQGSATLCLPQGTGTQYSIHASNFTYGDYYTAEATSTGWQNVTGGNGFPYNATYSYPANYHHYQPDIAAVDTNLPACLINHMHSATDYGYHVNHNGTAYAVVPPNNPVYAGRPEIFLRDDKPIVYYNGSASTFAAAGGGGFSLTEHESQMNSNFVTPGQPQNKTIGIGANRYLLMGERGRGCDYGEAVVIGIKANYDIEQLGKLSIPYTFDSITETSEDHYWNYYTIYENDTDVHPKWLIVLEACYGGSTGLRNIKAESFEITADLTAYVTST